MKKVVRMLGLCALVALAFTSCKKNETNGTLTFKASISQPASDSRTYLASDRQIAWSENDNILVFNRDTANYDFTVSTIGSQAEYLDEEATFVVNEPEKVAFLKDIQTSGKYVAFYPQAAYDTGHVSMTIPPIQDYNFALYEGGSFTTNTYPMFGVNDVANHFQFHSHAGVLQFNFGAPVGRYVRVKQIVVSAPEGDELVGTMTYPFDYPFDEYASDADVYTISNPSNEVVLNCGDGVVLPTPTPGQPGNPTVRFCIAVLRGALAEGFHVTVIGDKDDARDSSIIYENVPLLDVQVSNPENIIEAEKITNMSEETIPTPGQGGEPAK